MTNSIARLLFLLCLVCVLPRVADAQILRSLDRTFSVSADSLVTVRISGGPIEVVTGRPGTVSLTLEQSILVDTEREADRVLADYDISVTQMGGAVTARAKRREGTDRDGQSWRERNLLRVAARLTIPANVRLDLDTSGGPISVRGERSAAIKADTSGGPISVDGGRAAMELDTSGGPIKVGQVLESLHADTSGGGITVDYVGPRANSVLLDTSGGNIRVGVDRDAKFNLEASTSGGSVRVEGLVYDGQSTRRSRANGRLNGGGGPLRADTSGGSIEIHAARP